MDIPQFSDFDAKLIRAAQHVRELEEHALPAFRQARADQVTAEHDPDSGNYVVSVDQSPPGPGIAAIVGDAIANFRAALDFLVYSIAETDSGKAQSGTQFPIMDMPED